MQPHAGQVDTDVVTFVGLCFGSHADRGAWARPAGAENVLLISLGSAYANQPESRCTRGCLS